MLTFPVGNQLRCLHGRQRIQAAREVLPPRDRWLVLSDLAVYLAIGRWLLVRLLLGQDSLELLVKVYGYVLAAVTALPRVAHINRPRECDLYSKTGGGLICQSMNVAVGIRSAVLLTARPASKAGMANIWSSFVARPVSRVLTML